MEEQVAAGLIYKKQRCMSDERAGAEVPGF